MKRILVILLCSVLAFSGMASESTGKAVERKIERTTAVENTDSVIASKAMKVIKRWANGQDWFTRQGSDPYILENEMKDAVEALKAIQGTLLSQSPDFNREDDFSKICKYESDPLRVYYTEIGNKDLISRAIVIFNTDSHPIVYILVFKYKKCA